MFQINIVTRLFITRLYSSMARTKRLVGIGYVRDTYSLQTHWEATKNFFSIKLILLPDFMLRNLSSFLVDFYPKYGAIIRVTSTVDNNIL